MLRDSYVCWGKWRRDVGLVAQICLCPQPGGQRTTLKGSNALKQTLTEVSRSFGHGSKANKKTMPECKATAACNSGASIGLRASSMMKQRTTNHIPLTACRPWRKPFLNCISWNMDLLSYLVCCLQGCLILGSTVANGNLEAATAELPKAFVQLQGPGDGGGLETRPETLLPQLLWLWPEPGIFGSREVISPAEWPS